MKKILLYMLFVGTAAWFSCGGSTNQSNQSTPKKAISITKADFLTKVFDYKTNPDEWKYLGDKPAIIDFYADWCAPCKTLAPILEELAIEYADHIYVYKVNTEKERELATMFGIRAIPSLLFIPMNGEPQMAQGALPKKSLKELINNFLLSNE
jgi:thioredoxin